MKPKELNADEMREINGGYDEVPANPLPADQQPNGDTYPTSDGVGDSNESTYGTPNGPVRHYFP